MTIWYEVQKWSNEINQEEFVRDTESFLFKPSGRREKKSSEYSRWFPSLYEAKLALRTRLTNKIERCKKEIDESEYALRLLGY
jgi:hypothetical protein